MTEIDEKKYSAEDRANLVRRAIQHEFPDCSVATWSGAVHERPWVRLTLPDGASEIVHCIGMIATVPLLIRFKVIAANKFQFWREQHDEEAKKMTRYETELEKLNALVQAAFPDCVIQPYQPTLGELAPHRYAVAIQFPCGCRHAARQPEGSRNRDWKVFAEAAIEQLTTWRETHEKAGKHQPPR